MDMLVKLTYYGTNKPTLINLKSVTNIYQVFDKINRRFVTKVCFDANNYLNVEESLQTIMKLEQDHLKGEYQDLDFDNPQVFDERVEEDFKRTRRNQFEIYNENQW